MICLLDKMDLAKYPPRSYVMAATDAISETKAISAERRNAAKSAQAGHQILSCSDSADEKLLLFVCTLCYHSQHEAGGLKEQKCT